MSEQPAADAGLRGPDGADEARTLLVDGEIDVEGRMLDASNVTLFGTIRTGVLTAECVYKPVAGERPLWDFPDGTLAGREVSAALVSEATGWDVVPPTVLREGPFGPGMVQLWIDGDESVDLAAFVRTDHPGLRRMAVFDAVVNNADRKGGHIIPTVEGHVYGVDHGICFSTDPKLRTLLWRWAGKPLPVAALEVLEQLADDLRGDLGERLHAHLTRREVRATQQRVAELLRTQVHPEPSGEWPALPWPPFWERRPGHDGRIAAMPHRSRLSILLLDLPPEVHGEGTAFWAGATGRAATPVPEDADWASFGSFADGFHLEVQRTGEGTPPRWHVDIETDDIPAEVARLEALGARRHQDMGRFWQMTDPAGLVFCVVGIQTGAQFQRHAVTWP